MALLFDDDYRILDEIGLKYDEDEPNRFLIFRDFPLSENLYVVGGKPVSCVDVLYVIPPNYNTDGGDMFWLHPQLERADGKPIPNISGPGQDDRVSGGVVFCRWSRHWNNHPWRSKEDSVQRILDRIEWALKKPDANKS